MWVNALPKRLSVIIVTWNSELVIDDCLSSLDTLGLNDLETIVVDNHSRDGTIGLLKELEKSKTGKRLDLTVHYSGINTGWAKGAEEGVRSSSGKWILFCNPDIRFTKDFTELLNYGDSHKFLVLAPSLVTPSGQIQCGVRKLTMTRLFVTFTSLGQALDRWIARGFIFRDFQYANEVLNKPFFVDHPPGSFFLMRRDILAFLDGYLFPNDLPLYFNDSDLFARLQEMKISAVLLPSIRIYHRVSYSRNLVSSETYQYRIIRSMMIYAKKWRLHALSLAFLVLSDSIISPFVSYRHVFRPPRPRDILQSAYRLKGLVSA